MFNSPELWTCAKLLIYNQMEFSINNSNNNNDKRIRIKCALKDYFPYQLL